MKNSPAQILFLIAVVLVFGLVLGVWLSRVYSDVITIGRERKAQDQVRPKASFVSDVVVISDRFFAEKSWAFEVLKQIEDTGVKILIVHSDGDNAYTGDDRLAIYDRLKYASENLQHEGVAAYDGGLYAFASDFAYHLGAALGWSVKYVPLELRYANFTTDGKVCIVSDTFEDRMAARRIMVAQMGCEKDYVLTALPMVDIRDYTQFYGESAVMIKDAASSLSLSLSEKAALLETIAFLSRRLTLNFVRQDINHGALDFFRIGRRLFVPEALNRLRSHWQSMGFEIIEIPESINRYAIAL